MRHCHLRHTVGEKSKVYRVRIYIYGGFPKLGVPFFGGPYNKDYSILGSILGSPNFAKLPYRSLLRLYRDNRKEDGYYYAIIGYVWFSVGNEGM